MQIVTIFANPPQGGEKRYPLESGLFAVQFPEHGIDELKRNLANWGDPEFLEQFYEEQQMYLQGFSQDKFIDLIMEQTDAIEDVIFDPDVRLEDLFIPLDKGEAFIFKDLSEAKIKSLYGKTLKIRIYAIRIDLETYLVTGAAIKLTQTMQEHALTQMELDRLSEVKKILKAGDVHDLSSFDDFLMG